VFKFDGVSIDAKALVLRRQKTAASTQQVCYFDHVLKFKRKLTGDKTNFSPKINTQDFSFKNK